MPGMLMHGSHVPAQELVWTIYLVATQMPGINAVPLPRQLGISSDTTAWHRLQGYDTNIDVRKWHIA